MTKEQNSSSPASTRAGAPSASSAPSSAAVRLSLSESIEKARIEAMKIPEVKAAAERTANAQPGEDPTEAIAVGGRRYVLSRGSLVGLAPLPPEPSPEVR